MYWAIRCYEIALEEGIKFFVYGNLDYTIKKPVMIHVLEQVTTMEKGESVNGFSGKMKPTKNAWGRIVYNRPYMEMLFHHELQ